MLSINYICVNCTYILNNNMLTNSRKNLDGKTIELQNKVKYWTELSSEERNNIPLVS